MNRIASLVLLSLLLIAPAFAELTGPAPEFTLKGIDGQEVTLASFKDKIVIVDFWATFCPPCRAEIPGFIDIANAYKEKGVEVIGISTDKEMDKIRSFVEKNKVTYTILQANEDVLKAYGNIQAIPTTFILDRNHKIVKSHVGFAEKSVFEDEIKALLAAPAEPAPATPAAAVPASPSTDVAPASAAAPVADVPAPPAAAPTPAPAPAAASAPAGN